MTDLASLQNHQIRLAARPVGMTTRDNWQFTTEAVSEPEDGGVLVKALSLSLDPAMRGWMNEGKSYIAPVEIGEVMRAGGIGKVVASKHAGFVPGDLVTGGLGVQEYRQFTPMEIKRQGISKIDLRMGSITQWLNVLGMPGMTGYFGLMDVGQPKEGDVVVVSGASGAVGQTVGQLAKIKGCRVVGSAGGQAKCDFVVNAAPGFSEHHSGLALDIGTQDEPPAEESFERTAAFAWLRDHAGEHGFVMSYPRDNPHGIVYEPWHWRFSTD